MGRRGNLIAVRDREFVDTKDIVSTPQGGFNPISTTGRTRVSAQARADCRGAEPPSPPEGTEGSYSPLPSTANVKANKKIKIATMIVNATRSRTPSPL
jgi:hypothetical protein